MKKKLKKKKLYKEAKKQLRLEKKLKKKAEKEKGDTYEARLKAVSTFSSLVFFVKLIALICKFFKSRL